MIALRSFAGFESGESEIDGATGENCVEFLIVDLIRLFTAAFTVRWYPGIFTFRLIARTNGFAPKLSEASPDEDARFCLVIHAGIDAPDCIGHRCPSRSVPADAGLDLALIRFSSPGFTICETVDPPTRPRLLLLPVCRFGLSGPPTLVLPAAISGNTGRPRRVDVCPATCFPLREYPRTLTLCTPIGPVSSRSTSASSPFRYAFTSAVLNPATSSILPDFSALLMRFGTVVYTRA
jgi:hypothetical protein